MIIALKIYMYLCVFIATEAMIYGFINIFNKAIPWDSRKGGLMASYVWMIPMYLILPYSFEMIVTSIPLSGLWQLFFIPIDFAVSFILATLLESLTGFILIKTIGFCPWGRYTYAERGIEFLGGCSRWDWSLIYGAIGILFHGFIYLLNGCLK